MSDNLFNRGLSRRIFVQGSVAVAAASLLGVAGLSFAEEKPAEEATEKPAFDMDEILKSNEDGSWTFTDQNGYEVTIPSLPCERFVMLQHHSLDMMCQLGAQDQIVGVLGKWKGNLGEYMLDVFPGIEGVAMGSNLNEWNVEEIAALEPDVVIAAPQAPEDAVKQIRALGIPVVTVSLRGEGKQAEAQSPHLANADAAYTEGCEWAVKVLGKLAGKDEQAKAIWDFVEESRERVLEAVGDVKDEDRVTAFVPMKDDQTYGNDKYVGCQLLRAGAINVAAASIQGNGSYTVEQLANWDPDVIIIQDRYMDLYEEFTTDPRFTEIRAVKEGNVLLAPYWTKPWGNPDTDSMALGELWLAHKFYPEAVPAEEVQERAEKFYKDFYGIEFTGTVDAE
ncbi:MAG: ABC transporter substrate-binding protein [Coriobacteriales bacterium]|nr:ABC transporter substrate-binding protein [Coriobacteriales bacterium]